MEKAILLNRISDLRHWNKEYTRIYFGNEFCSHLMPTGGDCGIIIDFCKKKKIDFTFLTGQLSSDGLKKAIKTAGFIGDDLKEAVVNDYGMMNFLMKKYPKCRIVLGRSLSRFIVPSKGSFLDRRKVRWLETDCAKELRYCNLNKLSFY